MINKSISLYWVLSILTVFSIFSCQQPGKNVTGSEYMPDMAHSIAYEADTYGYYYNNRWGSEGDLHKMVQPRIPTKGTIARGSVGGIYGFGSSGSHQGIALQANGAMPYYYSDTEDERIRAINDIVKNPFPITDAGLKKAEGLYNIYCGICHGDKGDGGGYLVRDNGGKYPVQPANFLTDEFIASSNGRYYHGIIYGRNLMSGYGDKLSYEERWQVIHYIRSLQAASKKLEYSEKSNTLNSVDVPAALLKKEEVATDSNTMSGDTINSIKR